MAHFHVFHGPQTKLRKGNVFTNVCQSFCPQREGVSAPMHARIHTTPLVRHPPWSDTPPGQTPPLVRHLPPRRPLLRAYGTHPTGMHSCCWFFFVVVFFCISEIKLTQLFVYVIPLDKFAAVFNEMVPH